MVPTYWYYSGTPGVQVIPEPVTPPIAPLSPRNDRRVLNTIRSRLIATRMFEEVQIARLLPKIEDTSKWNRWAAIIPQESWDKEDGSFRYITHRATYRLHVNVKGGRTNFLDWDTADSLADRLANILMHPDERDYGGFCIPHLTTLREDYRTASDQWVRIQFSGGFGYTLDMNFGRSAGA